MLLPHIWEIDCRDQLAQRTAGLHSYSDVKHKQGLAFFFTPLSLQPFWVPSLLSALR